MAEPFDPNPNLILPVGTQVVTQVETKGTDGKAVHPRGAVGVVIQSPADYWHSYRVRFPDGFEASFRRPELSVLSHYKQGEMRPEHPLAEYNLYDYVIYQTYNGYVMSQFKKLQADLRNKGQVKWKHVMHLIRLLLSGITVLKEGFVPVRVEDYRERLLSIKRGEAPWEEVEAWRLWLHREFDEAFEKTKLPERPDYQVANELLVKARRSMT